MKKFFKKEVSKKTAIISLSIFTAILVIGVFIAGKFMEKDEIKYNEFLEMVKNEEVEKIDLMGNDDEMVIFTKDNEAFITDNPKTEKFKEEMLLKGIEVENNSPEFIKILNISSFVFSMTLTLVIMIVLISFMRSNTKKKSKLVVERPKVKFDDIAGNQEAKEDMRFLVEFLKDSKKYTEIGAKLPKGVMLFGPPGTGKTLMAKAVAGESEVPFFYVSGSDFIEMFAGLGAKRVRDLFEQAKKQSPCIIFIDEIDAIGKKRGGNSFSNEQDQTIVAFLNEMDGFDSDNSIIVIAATNRLDILDPAVIRPGRFDRHVAINNPDLEARKQILELYAKSKKIDEDVDLEGLAKITIGLSGASLEVLMNEAAIIAANRGATEIQTKDIDEAYFKIIMKGNAKKNGHSDKDETKLVAYHEAGHALATKLLTNNHLHKVTIVPSTSGAGGVTLTAPKKMSLISKNEILNNIKVLYAGRAAEEILLGDRNETTSGASQDIKQATEYIKAYFAELGMGDNFGMILLEKEELYMKDAIELSKKLYDETLELLKEHKIYLDKIAEELIAKETISEDEINKIFE